MLGYMSKPNILLIMTDQHRLSAVGAYGPTICRTPNIDALADDGVLFERAYTTCPVCSPARGSIMTGQYPHSHGITSNVHNLGNSIHELEDRPELLSRRLESEGYHLGYSGKWHLGTDSTTAYGGSNRPCLPKDVGFTGQNFPGHGGGGHKFPEFSEYLAKHELSRELAEWDHETPRFWPAGEELCSEEATVPYFLTENTNDMIRQFSDDDEPFFIWHNFWGPHGPYYAPTEYVDLYRDVEIPEWPNYRWPSRSIPGPHHNKLHPLHEELTWDAWATMIRYYYAFTTLIDAQIGRMIDTLRECGQLENTVIIFTADHGETMGSHGGLVDKGWHHFEETHRIPLIVRLPDILAGDLPEGAVNGKVSGTRREEFASLADIYPTILDCAGAEIEEKDIHGRSLCNLISGRAKNWRDSVVTEFGGVNNLATTMRTIRCGDLKYGFNCSNNDELYDLRRDPDETENVIDHPNYRRRADEMRRLLLDWMVETGDPAHWRTKELFSYYLEDLRVYNHPYR